jgi:hypothetical protein
MRRIGMSELASSSPTLVAAELFAPLNRHDFAETRPYHHPDVVEDFIAFGRCRGIYAVLGVFSEDAFQSPWPDVLRGCMLINEGSACVALPDVLGKPLSQVEREDPFSGLGGHSQDDRGDDASWRV